MQGSPWPNFLCFQLVETSAVKDQSGMGLEPARGWREASRPVLSHLGLYRSQQDLFCLIQLAFQGTEYLCSHSCLGPWEMLRGASLLGDVSWYFVGERCFVVWHFWEMFHSVALLGGVAWCFLAGRSLMVFPCCPQADVLECGIT